MPVNKTRPPAGNRRALAKPGQDFKSTVSQRPAYTNIVPLVDLYLEGNPDVAYPVVVSLVVEALDLSADLTLCEQWARDRQNIAPVAICTAHAAHTLPYELRRAQQFTGVAT